MKKKICFVAFGLFIEKLLKEENVNITRMCGEIRMGKNTYGDLKKGYDKRLSFYLRIFDYYCKIFTNEEMGEKAKEWMMRYMEGRSE